MAELIRFRINGKNGYKTRSGTVVVDPQFDGCVVSFGKDSVSRCPYGLVNVDDKYGVINEDGEIVIPIVYQEVIYLFNNLFAVRRQESGNDWSFGVLDDSNKIIVPFEYKYVASSGIFLFCYSESTSYRTFINIFMYANSSVYDYNYGDHHDVYNSSGKMIYTGQTLGSSFSFIRILDNEKLGIINSNGVIVLRPIYNYIEIVRDDRFIVRIHEGENWDYFIMDSEGNQITKDPYKFISTKDGFFYQCFKCCELKEIKSKYVFKEYSYELESGEVWLNAEGKIIHNGSGEVLSRQYFSACKNNTIGIYNFEGKRIVNFQFTSARLLGDKIIVQKEDKIGIVGGSGEIVVDVSYRSIEFVRIKGSVEKASTGYNDYYIYGNYNSKHAFDTMNLKDPLDECYTEKNKLSRYIISSKRCNYDPHDNTLCDCTMILRGDDFAELFSIKDGIIDHSRFDEISQLTNISYVVKSNTKYGIYRSDTKNLILPCEYDRIVFEGGSVVILYKNGLCGARTLLLPSHPLYSLFYPSMPIAFREIKIIDNFFQLIFGVKQISKDNEGNVYEKYTIVNGSGEEFPGMSKFSGITSQFSLYEPSRVLCSISNKFGFISMLGYVSIPFKYDQITERTDYNFDVRIENNWGVLSLDGKEIVAVKYSKPIPANFSNAIVMDSLSKRKGILSENGSERIPAIYKHLIIEGEFTFFCFWESKDYFDRDFFVDADDGNWGCLDKDGRIIIEPKYDCFEVRGESILAGRDREKWFYDKYDRIYDLYNTSGNLLISGFREFKFLETAQLYLFLFSDDPCKLLNNDKGRYNEDYNIDEKMGGWVVLFRDFTSVKLTKDGGKFIFPQKDVNLNTSRWNFPVDIFFRSKPYLEGDYLLTSGQKQSMALRISDGKETNIYDDIKYIEEGLFFVSVDEKVGLIDIEGRTIVPIEYVVLTNPVKSFIFGITELEDDKCNVDLLDLHNENVQSYRAVTNGRLSSVLQDLLYARFLIHADESIEGLKSISTYDYSIYDEDFRERICCDEKGERDDCSLISYWFGLSVRKSFPYNDYSDETDYAGDTWDAMTDGMYGDMPDGFDGDYDFLGH